MGKIGLQLYSIKELTQEDFLGTLKDVKDAGYDGVEFAGFFDTPAKELKKTMDGLGLVACGSHTGIDLLLEDFDKTIDYNLEIGNPYIVCPGLPEHMRNSTEAYKKLSDLFNDLGQKCKDKGLQFGYHNHAVEFEKYDSKHGLDILLSNTDPDLVKMELDVYWVEYANVKALDFMKRFPKHCDTLIHIKDMKDTPERENTEIGKGIIDFVEIVEYGKKLGIGWYIVEQEAFDIPQLESIKESYEYLKSIL
ncbi:MAG: sugar phosphate isomerase/epimerase [Clostridiales bacterium]|nr:sugar phosphate isomerase/epimerase [Clostridiales bacterium]